MLSVLDRSKMPPIRPITNLSAATPNIYQLDNGIPVHEINLGTQEVFKLEVIFYAGRPFEDHLLVSRATASLLKEGTSSKDSAAIAEEIDYYGASLSTPYNLDTASLVLYGMTKHLKPLLHIISEILTTATFPQHELVAFIKRSKEKLKIDLRKNDVVAYRTITESIFGQDHPYGYNSMPTSYETLTRGLLKAHFEKTFHANNCMIFASGKLPPELPRLLNRHLGILPSKAAVKPNVFPAIPKPSERIQMELGSPVQTSIKLGRPLFNRSHPDYIDAFVVNTILGGYFGSRLMKNIRERLGYTYNIYSSIDPMLYDGYFYISTEVGKEFANATFEEIYKEMEHLKRVPPSDLEMEMVKNYLLGTFLNSVDGPFNNSELVKTLLVDGLELSFYEKLIQRVKTISPEEVQQAAIKLFDETLFWEVAAN